MSTPSKTTVPAHESLRIALMMALIGGFLDAYTYLSFDGVFAFAQTGNLVLLGAHLANGEWLIALRFLLPIAVFFFGILFSEWLKDRTHRLATLSWEQRMMLIQGVLLLLVGVFGSFVPHLLSLTIINFACSLQMHAFRRVHGAPYVSTMCTGNLRSAAELLYHSIRRKNRQAQTQARYLLLIVACFVAGATLGGLMTYLIGIFAVFLILPLLVFPFVWLHRKA